MVAARQRITVLVTRAEKARITKMAKEAGVSRGEYLRRAALVYCSPVEEAMLGRMIEDVPIDAVPAGKRIGVAKGKFTMPDSVDKHNAEVANLFLGGQT